MPMIPNLDCVIVKETGTFDRFGQRVRSWDRTKARCAIVRMRSSAEKTSVRTDVSASHGNAEELATDARLLFPPITKIGIGDYVEVMGMKLVVQRVFPRVSVATGGVDHIEVDANVWNEGV